MSTWKVMIDVLKPIRWQYEALPWPNLGKFRMGDPHTGSIALWQANPDIPSAMVWALSQAGSLGILQGGISLEEERPVSTTPKKYHIVTILAPYIPEKNRLDLILLKYYVRDPIADIYNQVKVYVDNLLNGQNFSFSITEEKEAV